MKTLAIISSYSESCGNAAFTKVLHDSIETYSDMQVEVIELNLKLLQSVNLEIRRHANAHIEDICRRIKEFDLVNIQLEASLYGTLPSDIVKRVKKIINANSNTTVTLHSPRLIHPSGDFRSCLKKIFSWNAISGIRDLSKIYVANINIKMNKKIITYAIKKKCRLIVHTKRAQEQIKLLFGYEQVDVHPLKLIPADFQSNDAICNKLKVLFEFKETDISIGLFGYISSYKGHLDAIAALKYLPDNCKLLICGRQHPQTLGSSGRIDKYLESLLTLINKEKLESRVFFIGELSDEDFLHVASSVDVAWLPYYENGQDGSGIASICFDVCKRVLCSSSLAFDELFKLIKYNNFLRFDIGNSLEIANKTKMIMRNDLFNVLPQNSSPYTIRSQSETYIKKKLVC